MDNTLYDYSPLKHRPPLTLPGGARLAFWIGLNIEHFVVDKRSTSISPATTGIIPDPLNHGWRDYGTRVGIWRMMDCLDRHGLRASVLLNSDVCLKYPQIIEEGNRRGWAWLAHGKTNSVLQTGMTEEEERAYLSAVIDTIRTATGRMPRGWLGPALSETFNTPNLLEELGLEYTCDWCADDQPFRLNTRQRRLISVPYSIEVNDIPLFLGKSLSGADFRQIVTDQFDMLYAEGAQSARVMCLSLHPFITGQPFRLKYLDQALEYIRGHKDVWFATSDEIAQWYAGLPQATGSAC
jgi:allantoinase